MWNATVIAGNARHRLRSIDASPADGDPGTLLATAREQVVARHLLGLERLFSHDDPVGCLAEFEAAGTGWLQATAAPQLRPHVRKSWSLALEGAIVAGRWELAAALAERTATAVVPPEYDDEFAAAACLELWVRAAGRLSPQRAAVERLCDVADGYLGAPQPLFAVFRAAAGAAPDFAARFADWHAFHLREVDERLAGTSMRPFEMMLAHCWTRGLAVLRCAQRGGFDLATSGLLLPRRFVPVSLSLLLEEESRG